MSDRENSVRHDCSQWRVAENRRHNFVAPIIFLIRLSQANASVHVVQQIAAVFLRPIFIRDSWVGQAHVVVCAVVVEPRSIRPVPSVVVWTDLNGEIVWFD